MRDYHKNPIYRLFFTSSIFHIGRNLSFVKFHLYRCQRSINRKNMGKALENVELLVLQCFS